MSLGRHYSSPGGHPPQSDGPAARASQIFTWGFLLLAVATLSIDSHATADEKPPLTTAQATTAQAYEFLRQRPVTKEDISILKRADEILSSETIWNRNDTRQCYRLADSWSLYCALKEACIEVLGKYEHRRVALEEVRLVIEETAGFDRTKPNLHSLRDYNNLTTTKFEDIKRVLKITLEREAARLK
jgi:hypothetical protein